MKWVGQDNICLLICISIYPSSDWYLCWRLFSQFSMVSEMLTNEDTIVTERFAKTTHNTPNELNSAYCHKRNSENCVSNFVTNLNCSLYFFGKMSCFCILEMFTYDSYKERNVVWSVFQTYVILLRNGFLYCPIQKWVFILSYSEMGFYIVLIFLV